MAEDGRGEKMDVDFDGKRCIHARQCVMGFPAVFRAGVEGNWIYPDAAEVEELAAMIRRCPSGALTFTRKDGGAEEAAPLHNQIQVQQDGPLYVRADVTLGGERRGYRMALCRCGGSRNKPFCDNTHRKMRFDATGEPAALDEVGTYPEHGVLEITPLKDGPLQVRGPVEVTAASGRPLAKVGEQWLCRCGKSESKPFCDSSHRRFNFRADGAE